MELIECLKKMYEKEIVKIRFETGEVLTTSVEDIPFRALNKKVVSISATTIEDLAMITFEIR